MDLDGDALVRIYRTMATIRACDDKAQKLILSGRLQLFFHSPRGQEAVAAGTASVLRPDDYLVATYRSLHDSIAKGLSLRQIWAEWLGRLDGCCQGRGGPMHLADPDIGLMATSGIVGGGLPIGVGLAFGSQVQQDGRVTVCNFGDGASNIGGFHEALNLAGVWRLPIVFVCQNNGYAEHMRYEKATSVERIALRAQGYGMPGVTVDGNDPVVVAGAVGDAAARARAGEGPSLVEAMTYRLSGHFVGDDQKYLPRDEVKAAKAADPVPVFRARLIRDGVASEADLAAIDTETAQAVDDAHQFAEASPSPDPGDILTYVFADASGVSA